MYSEVDNFLNFISSVLRMTPLDNKWRAIVYFLLSTRL